MLGCRSVFSEIRMMNLNHLRSFAALSQAGSFNGAARRLGMPVSTLSDHIAALEAALGLQLVIRSTRSLRLTADGTALAGQAQRVAEAAQALADHAAAARAQPAGRVRLSLPFALAREVVAPLIGRFLADWPDVTVDLILSNRRDDLIDEGIDIALRTGPAGQGGALLRRVIARAGQGVFAAPGLAERIKSLSDLTAPPFFAFEPVTLQDGPARVTLTPRLTANDPETLARAAQAAGGVTLGPGFVARAAGLVPVLPHLALPPADIALVSAARVAGLPAAARLADFLAAEVAPALRAAQGR
jgi:DNA-binding transcriptional LysR family regulator